MMRMVREETRVTIPRARCASECMQNIVQAYLFWMGERVRVVAGAVNSRYRE